MVARTSAVVSDPDDRLLVKAAQQDPARFADLYDLNFDRVYAYIFRRVRDHSLAEDLTADVFHKALAALQRFDWRGIPFAVWLLRIAANVVVDQWKRDVREVVSDPPEQMTETDLAEVEHRARIFRLVAELPQDHQQVIEMRFSEGKSVKEIALQIGRSEGAVKQLQFRALQKLKSMVMAQQSGRAHV